MKTFRYKVYDQAGALREGLLQAATQEAALESLSARGQIPVEIVPTTAAAAGQRWWDRELTGSGALPLAALSIFTRELATLVKASLPVEEALRILAVQPAMSARARSVTRAVHLAVTEGASLSEALAAQGRSFPEYVWRLVRAGEASGNLGTALDELATFIERTAQTRAQLVSALIYPAILLVAACIALVIIMGVLLPTIVPLFQDAGVQPPLIVRTLVSAQQLVTEHWLLSAIGSALGLGALIASLRIESWKLARDRLLLKLPIVASVVSRGQIASFARTLSTLTRNGVPLLEAARTVAGVMSNRVYRRAIEAAIEELKVGSTLSQPLANSGLFEDLPVRLVAVGEKTGSGSV